MNADAQQPQGPVPAGFIVGLPDSPVFAWGTGRTRAAAMRDFKRWAFDGLCYRTERRRVMNECVIVSATAAAMRQVKVGSDCVQEIDGVMVSNEEYAEHSDD